MQPIFIAGPCVIESATLLNTVAHELVRINRKYGINIIFKASFDKANRTSIHSFRGPGLDKGLQMLADIKAEYGLQILTDIHESCQAEAAGEATRKVPPPAGSPQCNAPFQPPAEQRKLVKSSAEMRR